MQEEKPEDKIYKGKFLIKKYGNGEIYIPTDLAKFLQNTGWNHKDAVYINLRKRLKGEGWDLFISR